MQPQIITEADIRNAVSFDETSITAVEAAFAGLSGGAKVLMPPVMQITVDASHGLTCVKSSYTDGAPYFVVKLASTYHDNHHLGIPASSGLMLICSAATGHVECILLDNGYLTALRTQAAGAVASRHLARADARSAGVIGSGRQARLQLTAIAAVRKLERAAVWSPDVEGCAVFATEMSAQLGFPVVAVDGAEAAVRGSDIIVTATPAKAPIIRAEWLSPGQHITAMGADAPGKSELFPDVVAAASRYVCDSAAQCRTLSDLNAAIAAGAISADHPVLEIGDVIAGQVAGRTTDRDITVADLTGLGVQDTAIALLAWNRISGRA